MEEAQTYSPEARAREIADQGLRPVFVTRDVNDAADALVAKLAGLHEAQPRPKGKDPAEPVSRAYLAEARERFLARAVRVSDSMEANYILSGRS